MPRDICFGLFLTGGYLFTRPDIAIPRSAAGAFNALRSTPLFVQFGIALGGRW